jgi:hypothetical protein
MATRYDASDRCQRMQQLYAALKKTERANDTRLLHRVYQKLNISDATDSKVALYLLFNNLMYIPSCAT